MCRENFKDIICYHNENFDYSTDISDEGVFGFFISKIAITFLVSVILYICLFHLVRNLRNICSFNINN